MAGAKCPKCGQWADSSAFKTKPFFEDKSKDYRCWNCGHEFLESEAH